MEKYQRTEIDLRHLEPLLAERVVVFWKAMQLEATVFGDEDPVRFITDAILIEHLTDGVTHLAAFNAVNSGLIRANDENEWIVWDGSVVRKLVA